MAWSLGYPDGQRVPAKAFVDACARVARVTQVPMSVDVERGFGDSVEDACELVRALIGLGVVGINIEDGLQARTLALNAPDDLLRRVEALRTVADRAGVALFINARSDVFLARGIRDEMRCDEAQTRSRLYASAGADGFFVPGLAHLPDIARLGAGCALPLNVYAGGLGIPAVATLAANGVRRVSLGCGPLQAMAALLQGIAHDAFTTGRYDAMVRDQMSGDLLNQLFQHQTERGLS
jgi:2-methylisocitrate lyase-like PEP mutase family enzyme